MPTWRIITLFIIECLPLSQVTIFIVNLALSDSNIVIPVTLVVTQHIFPCLLLIYLDFLVVKSGFLIDSRVRSFSPQVHSDNLCILINVFRPFIFKVNTDVFRLIITTMLFVAGLR